MAACTQCGKSAGFMLSLCEECSLALTAQGDQKAAERAIAEEAARRQAEEFLAALQRMPMSTTGTLPGHRILDGRGIVVAEYIVGMNIWQGFTAELRSEFGGRSKGAQDVTRRARATCLDDLRIEAHARGANAVIGIDFDYGEMSNIGQPLIVFSASGTAILAEPLPSSPGD